MTPGAETPASQRTGEESERPDGTGEDSEPPDGTGEESEHPDIANRLDWETFKAKLSRFFQMLSVVEVAGLESSNSFFSAPTRRTLWSRAFFFPRMEPSWVPNMSLGNSARGICTEI